jgi:hypothetical protein
MKSQPSFTMPLSMIRKVLQFHYTFSFTEKKTDGHKRLAMTIALPRSRIPNQP